jgi:hypothetical protein
MTEEEKWELVRSVRLCVSPEQAREELLQIKRKAFRDALETHWEYEDENVTPQSKLWLLSWAQDTRSLDIAYACQAIWNRIFDKEYESVAIVGHDSPRQYRYGRRGPIDL